MGYKGEINSGGGEINMCILMVYTTHLWWMWEWFIIGLTTLLLLVGGLEQEFLLFHIYRE